MIRRFAPIAALAVAGCMTAPLPPPTIAPESATGAFATLPTASIAPVPDDWWRLYDDPALERLVQASLAANADLRVAYANLAGARRATAANHDRERRNDR
jgi:outer membrane protein TolC